MHPLVQTVRGSGYTLGMSALAMGRVAAGSEPTIVRDMARQWAVGMCERLDIEVRGVGVGALAWDAPHVLMANHQSYLDVLALYRVLPVAFGMIAKRELFGVPFFSGVMRALGCVSIDRDHGPSAHRALLDAAAQVRAGSTIVVFPEGTRSLGDRVQPLKKGPFHLVQAAGAPIVPIGIRGSAKLMSRKGVGIRAGSIEVHVGAPLSTEGSMGASGRSELAQRVRAALCELTDLPPLPDR